MEKGEQVATKVSKRRRAVKIFGIIGILLIILISLLSVVIGLIATPAILTPRIVEIAQKEIKSDISIKSVDISLFDRFPNVTLRIDSLRITQTKDSIDDLIFARECRVAINPFALVAKKLVVNHLSLKGASMYIYVDSLNGPLKHFRFNDNVEKVDAPKDSLDSFDLTAYSAFLRRLRIDSMQLTIDDRTKRFYTRVDNFGVDMSFNLSLKISKVDVVTGFSNLIVWHDGDLLVKKTAMKLDSKFLVDMDSLKLSFRKADVQLNGIDFKSSGSLRRDSTSNALMVDINSALSTPSLSEFLELIPSSLIAGKEKITTKGEVDLNFDIKGAYSEELLPTIAATIKVDNAQAKYASRKLSLESVSCDAYTFVDFNAPQNSYADIKKLHINTSGIIDLNLSGRVDNLLDNQNIDLALKSVIDFDRFTEVFPLNEGIICSGTNRSDIKAQFRANDILANNYANLFINGESLFQDLEISFDATKFEQDSTKNTAYLNMKAQEGRMLFGDRVRPDTDSRTLLATINFSGLNYQSKSGEYLSINDLELSAGANFDRVTSAVNGIGIRGVAQNTEVGIDSLFSSKMESSDVTFTISPKSEKHDTKIVAKISSQRISANEPNYSSDLRLSSVEMNLNMLRIKPKEWDMDGTVGFSNLGMYTELFPLNIKIPETNVSVTNRTIYLNNARLKVGESELLATGHINNLLHKIFVTPRIAISGELAITAPTLNISELMVATNSSVLMMSDDESEVETSEVVDTIEHKILEATVSVATEEEAAIDLVAESAEVIEEFTEETASQLSVQDDGIIVVSQQIADTLGVNNTDSLPGRRRPGPPVEGALFLVPRNIDFVFDLNIDKALFEDATIDNVVGRASLKKGELSLEKLSLSAIGGVAEGTMIYRNINRRSANIAFNMQLSDVDINRIGELVPSISSMFPMLDSFEGIVDFGIKATANLNSDSEIDISTLKSAMEFKGENLVLMDSETFADLSKTLMFKNKERNLIESLDVYALVNESKVDVLPFLMTIDRYQAIIGGTQTVDPVSFNVEYNYNISIIKSPLPFKAGVDIVGDLNDFDFKVTKAKLKGTDFEEQTQIYERYRDSIE
ncbi:MAG: hypothetical protein R3Y08_06025 [Rikenellaceae bacterium]